MSNKYRKNIYFDQDNIELVKKLSSRQINEIIRYHQKDSEFFYTQEEMRELINEMKDVLSDTRVLLEMLIVMLFEEEEVV